MSVTAVVACFNSDPNSILANLAAQTRPPDEVLVTCSGKAEDYQIDAPQPDYFEHVENEPDFAYSRRNRVAGLATKDWLFFPCHDDSYHPRFLELMLAASQDQDIVWCPWSDIPTCKFRPCDSTLGNFLIRRALFEEMGRFVPFEEGMEVVGPAGGPFAGKVFKGPGDGFRDAWLIKKLLERPDLKVAEVPHILYYHNIPYSPKVRATSWGSPVRGISHHDWVRLTNHKLEAACASQ